MVDSVESRVVGYFSKFFGVGEAEITRKSSLNDLGADSNDQPDLILELEDMFDINLPDEAVELDQTVGQIVDRITKEVETIRV